MPVQIPEPVKSARSDILLEMTQRQSEQFRAQFIGKQDELLLEEKAQMPFGLCWRGHTKRYESAMWRDTSSAKAIPAPKWRKDSSFRAYLQVPRPGHRALCLRL